MHRKRIEWLDYMKGIAILIVVIGHVAQTIGEHYSFTRPIIIGEMPLFFLLSGILANQTVKRSVLENYKKKFLSLGVPFVTVGATYAFCIGSLCYFFVDMYHMSFWFLLSLLSCWLIFIPIHKCAMIIPWRLIEAFLLILPYILFKLFNNNIPQRYAEALTLNFTFTYYRFFVLGYFLGIYYRYMKNKWVLGTCVVTSVVLIFMTLIDYSLLDKIPMTIQQLVLSACFSGAIYVVYLHSSKFIKMILKRYLN